MRKLMPTLMQNGSIIYCDIKELIIWNMITALTKEFLQKLDTQSCEMPWIKQTDQFIIQCAIGEEKILGFGLDKLLILGEPQLILKMFGLQLFIIWKNKRIYTLMLNQGLGMILICLKLGMEAWLMIKKSVILHFGHF